jgi:hypothetical protein
MMQLELQIENNMKDVVEAAFTSGIDGISLKLNVKQICLFLNMWTIVRLDC